MEYSMSDSIIFYRFNVEKVCEILLEFVSL